MEILSFVSAFFIGSISFGHIIAKLKGVDLRQNGSGSTGATNVGRLLGAKAALVTVVLDSLKGVVAVLMAQKLAMGEQAVAVAGFSAVLGHCFSPWLGFRGGKGVATSLGVLLAIQPLLAAICLVAWVATFAVWRIVSVASITAAVALIVYQLASSSNWAISLIGLLIIVLHRENIVRLMRGEEKRFKFNSADRIECEVGFIVHQVHNDPDKSKQILVRKFAFLKYFSANFLHYCLMPRIPLSRTKMGYALDVESQSSGEKVNVIFWAVPYSPEQMEKHQPVDKVVKAARLCAKYGAKIVGLGAFTSIIGEKGGGIDVAAKMEGSGVGITSGNSLTAATGAQALLLAAESVGYDPAECTVAIIGARGSIGSSSAHFLAKRVRKVCLVGKPGSEPLNKLATSIGPNAVCMSIEEAQQQSQLIITATGASGNLNIDASLFLPGAIICDVARPRDVGEQVAKQREDILVIDGGILKLPGDQARVTFDIGLGPGNVFACMAEAILLGFEKRYENYSLGRFLKPEQIEETSNLALKHGLKVADFRSFDQMVSKERLERHRKIVESMQRNSA